MRPFAVIAGLTVALAACAGARLLPRAEPMPSEAAPAEARPSEVVRAEAPAPARAEAPAAAVTPSAPAEPPRPKPVYERILGSYSVDPDLVVYLNPELCVQQCRRGARPEALREISQADSARVAAVVHLHRGALLWVDGYGENAYREIMQARHGFAALGDVQGLAHTYEWLGFVFRESHATDQAAEHFAVAYRMFELVGNRAAALRVLSYGEP